MKKNLPLILLIIIVGLGLFLRSYKISDNYYFSGELGKEMLYIREFVLTKTLPTVGMTTSHEWLSYGPFYYWLMIPLFILFKGSPFILFWVSWVVAGAGLVLNYYVLKRIVNEKIALISTALMAVSPLLIWQTRLSKLHVFFWVLIPLFMLATYFLWQRKKKWLLPAGLLFGVLFSFHFSQIPILGVIGLLFLIKRRTYGFSDYLKFGIGVLIPNISYILHNLKIALWLPYRVLNIENKNPEETVSLLNEYFGKNFFWDNRFWLVASLIFFAVFIHYVLKNKTRLTKEFLPFFLISSIGLMLVGNVLHGAPPVHYFLPVFTIVPILLAIYLSKIKFWPVVVIIIAAVNMPAFYGDPLFYLKFKGNSPNPDIVQLETQYGIASTIIAASKGEAVSIKRVGPYDYFPENYSQNYKYLVIYNGGSIVDNSLKIYTIVEASDGVYVQK